MHLTPEQRGHREPQAPAVHPLPHLLPRRLANLAEEAYVEEDKGVKAGGFAQ
jgi:hypothetical protein